MHITETKAMATDFEFYISLNPNFLLTLARSYLELGQPTSLAKATKLLETITSKIPGYVNAYLLLAQSQYPVNPALSLRSV